MEILVNNINESRNLCPADHFIGTAWSDATTVPEPARHVVFLMNLAFLRIVTGTRCALLSSMKEVAPSPQVIPMIKNKPGLRTSASSLSILPRFSDMHVASPRHLLPRPSLRKAGGFSLVEVAMALGLFAFAIIPVIGMMGTGLSVSKDSIESSTLAQIFRQAEAYAATNTDNAGTLYFTRYGEQTNLSGAIYQMSFSNATPTDAAAGLLARRLLQTTVVKAAATNVAIPNGTRFLQLSKDPADLRTNNFW